MVRILVVQPSEMAPVGRLEDWLSEAGAALDLVAPADSELPENLDGYAALVVMGGPMGALDDREFPWLADVRALLSQAASRSLPVLSICLGAQLLAAATGGQVRVAPDGPESGTLLVAKRDAAAEDPLLGPLPLTPDVVQFHSDEIRELPPSATLLASSPKCHHQAFRVGDFAYGLQFHIETTTAIVQEWARSTPAVAGAARKGQWETEHLDRFHEDMAEVWQPVVERFVQLAATPPEERKASRFLPLV